LTQYGKERSEVGVNKKARRDVQGVEENIYKKTSISSAGFRLKNEDGSRCVRLYYRRDVIYRV